MMGARLGDRFGHRRVLLGGIALFAVGSLCAATAGVGVGARLGRALPAGSGRRDLGAGVVAAAHRRHPVAGRSPRSAHGGLERRRRGGRRQRVRGSAECSRSSRGGAPCSGSTSRWPLIIAAGVLGSPSRRAAQRPVPDSTCPAGSCSAPESRALVLGGSLLQTPAHAAAGRCGGGRRRSLSSSRRPGWNHRARSAAASRRRRCARRALRTGAGRRLSQHRHHQLGSGHRHPPASARPPSPPPGAVGLRLMPLSLSAIAGASLAAPALRRAPAPGGHRPRARPRRPRRRCAHRTP